MICDECKKDVGTLNQSYYGSYCDTCVKGSDDRARKLYAELLAEEPLAMPELLKLEDFERFMLKFSLRYIEAMPAGDKQRLRGETPQLLKPFVMSMHLKDLVVDKMPLNYVSSLDAEGLGKMFYGAVYQFKRPVPRSVVLKALEDAGLIQFGGDREPAG